MHGMYNVYDAIAAKIRQSSGEGLTFLLFMVWSLLAASIAFIALGAYQFLLLFWGC